MMRIRSKIGYSSFKHRKTVSELLINQILRSYNKLVNTKQIAPIADYS